MERIQRLNTQLSANQHLVSDPAKKCPNDVVICCALRTCMSGAKKGPLRNTMPEVMLTEVLKGILQRTKVDPKLVEDLAVGNCLQPGAGAVTSRAAQLMAGFPVSTTCVAINRQCSSGIEACAIIAGKIKSGQIDMGIGAGVESMTNYSMMATVDPDKLSEQLFEHETARNILIPMGNTSDTVAERYGLKRKDLDEFAVQSHLKASKAQKEGKFKDEIHAFKAKVTQKDGSTKEEMADQDTGIRHNSNYAALAKLKSSFGKDKWSTAGNSSQMTDGASGVLMCRRSTAEKLGLPIVGKFVSYAVVGVPPEIMGVGPAYAIPACLNKAGLKVSDVDVYELNEAFAAQALWCVQELKIPMAKVNPNGGAIALGHPLGCTGARLVASILPELKRTKGKFGVISMCIGTGMGAAALIQNE